MLVAQGAFIALPVFTEIIKFNVLLGAQVVFFLFFCFFFLSRLTHVEVPEPGTKPAPQLQPKPLQ